MEKINFGDHEFDLVPGGVSASEDRISIIFIPTNTGLDALEAMVRDPANTGRIEVLDETGGLLEPHEGYTIFGGIKKIPDYFICIRPVTDPAPADAPDTEPPRQTEEVYGDVVQVVLKKSDIRVELAKTNAKVEYVAMMAGIDPEV